MPNMDGLELQERLLREQPGLTTVIMTAYASVDTAVKALKAGAHDYIVKPFDPDELSHLIRRVREHRALLTENERLKQSLDAAEPAADLVGKSPAMNRVFELIDSVAPSDATVLVQGESGTGKELVARAIHRASSRRYNPMVVVHCAALAEGILESELFGHEKGAFTGANYHHKGKFEQADGGTVFLDEIGEISGKVQVELLRVLEEKHVTRVGGKQPIPVDFRIVAATNRDLRALVDDGRFREDLFWRLDVVTIDLPPLRERPDDIPLLAEHFVERFCRAMSRPPARLSPGALEAIRRHPWPGNVRELQNAIERALVLGNGETIEAEHLPFDGSRAPEAPRPAGRTLADVERAHIEGVLDQTDWNITRAASVLNVDRGTLYNKIKKYEITRPASHGA
jgi:DNA-binding NtrC family response regulator